MQLLIFIPGIFEFSHVGPLFFDVLLSCILYSFLMCGFFTNHLDIAPRHAHATMAVSNMMNVIATFLLWTTFMGIGVEYHEDDASYVSLRSGWLRIY